MGFVSDLVGGLFGGGSSSDASSDAASQQLASTKESIAFQKEALGQIRADLTPYREVGTRNISGLEKLVTDPNAQKDFITQNPFFDALAGRAKDQLFANRAARGKLGSGGTLEALQNSLLLLGEDLLNRDVTRRSNLVTIGQNAAAGTAAATQNSAGTISDLITQGGNAQAAGIVGAQNAKNNAVSTAAGIGGLIYALCDVRAKEIIRKLGELRNGLPLYLFKYKGEDDLNIGPVAQDVEKIMPDAVKEMNGLKHVDMEAVYGH